MQVAAKEANGNKCDDSCGDDANDNQLTSGRFFRGTIGVLVGGGVCELERYEHLFASAERPTLLAKYSCIGGGDGEHHSLLEDLGLIERGRGANAELYRRALTAAKKHAGNGWAAVSHQHGALWMGRAL